MQHGQGSGQVAVAHADGGGQRQGKTEDAVEGPSASQGEAVLDERQGGLWFVEPYRGCGRVEAIADSAGFRTLRAISTASVAGRRAAAWSPAVSQAIASMARRYPATTSMPCFADRRHPSLAMLAPRSGCPVNA